MNTKLIELGQLAKEANVSAEMLRYDQHQNLLPPATRSGPGYRLYSPDDVKKIGFIVSAKAVGFTFMEIQQLLSREVIKDHQSCADIKTLVDDKVVEVGQQLKRLRRIKKPLQTPSDACCGGDESATHCAIVETLNEATPSGPLASSNVEIS